jgi:hypothetical protein
MLTSLTDHQIISAAAEERNLLELTINQGFQCAKGVQAYKLGVDIRYIFRSPALSIPCHSDAAAVPPASGSKNYSK